MSPLFFKIIFDSFYKTLYVPYKNIVIIEQVVIVKRNKFLLFWPVFEAVKLR